MTEEAEEIRSLLSEREGMTDALASVLEVAETGDGTVVWSDVSNDISESQWGCLLQTDVLIEAGGRFVINNPVAAEEALERAQERDSDEATNWSYADKLAGVGAITLSIGYQVPEIRTVVGETVDIVLGPLEAILPFYFVLLLLAAGTGIASIFIQSRMTDYEQMSEHQERMSTIRERLEDAKERGDEAAIERIQEEQMDAMTAQFGMFTQMLRPLAWTMLFTVPVLLWLYWLMLSPAQAVTPTAMVFPVLGRIAWTARVLGPMQAWLLWYMIGSVTSRQFIQKAFNIQTSPT
jgi:uncharacterized membrane protein (DUF106 family)